MNRNNSEAWATIASAIDELYSAKLHQRAAAVANLGAIIEVGDYSPKERESKDAAGAYRYWYGLIADGYHKRDIEMVRYSLSGMRLVVEEVFRKDSLWLRQDKGAA